MSVDMFSVILELEAACRIAQGRYFLFGVFVYPTLALYPILIRRIVLSIRALWALRCLLCVFVQRSRFP